MSGEQQQRRDVAPGRGGRPRVTGTVLGLEAQAQPGPQTRRAAARLRAAQRRLQPQTQQRQPRARRRGLRPAQHVGVCGSRAGPSQRRSPPPGSGAAARALTEQAAGEALRAGGVRTRPGPAAPLPPPRRHTCEQITASRGAPRTPAARSSSSSSPGARPVGPGHPMAPAPRPRSQPTVPAAATTADSRFLLRSRAPGTAPGWGLPRSAPHGSRRPGSCGRVERRGPVCPRRARGCGAAGARRPKAPEQATRGNVNSAFIPFDAATTRREEPVWAVPGTPQ